jgi:hypothetical protein
VPEDGAAEEAAIIAPRSEEEKSKDTAGCRRCQLTREGRGAKGVPHTEVCSKRMEDSLRSCKDPRLQAAEDNINER